MAGSPVAPHLFVADVLSGLDLTAGGQISNILALSEPVFRSSGITGASWSGKTAGDKMPSLRWGIQLRLSEILTLKLYVSLRVIREREPPKHGIEN